MLLADLIAAATQAQAEGDTERSSAFLLQANKEAPDNCKILRRLGEFYFCKRLFDLAADALATVVSTPAATADDWLRLSLCLHELGAPEAVAAMEQAAAMAPNWAEPWTRLSKLYEGKDPVRAVNAAARSVACEPNSPENWYNLGCCLLDVADADAVMVEIIAAAPELHRLSQTMRAERPASQDQIASWAVDALRRALWLRPDWALAWYNLGLAQLTRDPPQTVVAFAQAARLNPDWAEAWYNFGSTLIDLSSTPQAGPIAAEIIATFPTLTHPELGLQADLSQHENQVAALAAYALRRALQIRPDWALAWYNLGLAQMAYDVTASMVAFARAAQLRPDWSDAWYNLGTTLIDLTPNQQEEAWNAVRSQVDATPLLSAQDPCAWAEAALIRAAELGAPLALNNLGAMLSNQGRMREAAAVYERMAQEKTAPTERLSAYNSWIDALAQGEAEMAEIAAAATARWNAMFAQRGAAAPPWRWRPGERPLRVGVLSHYWHWVQMESVRQALTMMATTDLTLDFFPSSEIDAQTVRDAGYDVLLHLDGAFGGDIALLAARPAPAALTWPHFMWPYGGDMIDAAVTDAVVGAAYERGLILPGGFTAYDPSDLGHPSEAPPKGRPPTFGAFCRINKISTQSCAAWGRILAQAPQARLLLASTSLEPVKAREQALDKLRAGGVDLRRVEVVGSVSKNERWALFSQVDVMLETYPFNGAQSTFESLWMGVPTPAYAGDRPTARLAATLLVHGGLAPELLAPDPAAWERTCVDLIQDDQRRAAIASQQNARLAASPLCDVPRLARELRAALLAYAGERTAAAFA